MSAEATDKMPAATIPEGHRWWLFAACVLVSDQGTIQGDQ